MKKKKETLFFSLMALSLMNNKLNAKEAIHQHNTAPIHVPCIVDGTPLGINGHEVKKLIYIIREVEKILYGIPDAATKVRTGKYTFLNEMHSIATLAEYELENSPLSGEVKDEFIKLFKIVTEDFIRIATPFIEQAHGVKGITLGFMKEWAENHDREESSLLDWAKEKDGHEFDTFRKEVTSCEKLFVFCQDLISFVSDLIQSCPRAWNQFLTLQKKR